MTENYYITKSYELNHSTYKGIIYEYDFCNHMTMSDVTERIISDWKFDERCKRNIENRNKKGNKYE